MTDLAEIGREYEETITRGETRNDIAKLKEIALHLASYEYETVATNPSFGSLGFKSIVPTLRSYKELLTSLARLKLGAIPANQISALRAAITQFDSLFSEVADFDIRLQGASNTRSEIIRKLIAQYEEVFRICAPVLAFGLAAEPIATSLKNEVRNSVRSDISEIFGESLHLAEQLKQSGRDIQEVQKEALDTLAAMKEAAAQVGVSAYASVFSQQAAEHLEAAKKWGLATICAGVLALVWGALALWILDIDSTTSVSQIVHDAIAKLIVFSALSYGIVWCARNYSANRHNYVLNKHRQNSLTTFETFAKAAEGDDGTKNAILLQATTSIFSAQSTGYSAKEPELEQPSKVIEILRSVKS